MTPVKAKPRSRRKHVSNTLRNRLILFLVGGGASAIGSGGGVYLGQKLLEQRVDDLRTNQISQAGAIDRLRELTADTAKDVAFIRGRLESMTPSERRTQ